MGYLLGNVGGNTIPVINTGSTVIQAYRCVRVGDGDASPDLTYVHGIKIGNCQAISDATLSSTGNTGLYTQPPIGVAISSIAVGQLGLIVVRGPVLIELGSSETAAQGDDIILDQSENNGTVENGSLSIAGADPTSGLIGYAYADSFALPRFGSQGAVQDFTDNTTPSATITVVPTYVDFGKSLGLTAFRHTHS